MLLSVSVAWGQISKEKASELTIQAEMQYFSIESVRSAYTDFCRDKNYDAKLYGEKLAELERLSKAGGNESKVVELKREVLLSNPLLDNAKVIVGRYRVGNHARQVWAPSLGTQNNNWSNQSSSSRAGFDAEIAELSNLRGTVHSRTIFKPTNGSSVADLLLHWDGERILFTAADDNHRWGVYEVNRDGSNMHKVIQCDEPDLEFFYRIFKERQGISPEQYIVEYRVKRAKELLCFSQYSINEIATFVGVKDVYYFSRLFKRIAKISPTKYRNEKRSSHSS